MKRALLLLAVTLLLASGRTSAQTGLNFGVKAGYSIATQYGITPAELNYEVGSENRNCFTGGILLYFPITDAFGVQQEFIYSQKGSVQDVSMTEPPVTTSSDYKINYFELPILFKYNFFNIRNIGIYGSSGFALSVLIDGEYDISGSVMTPVGEQPISESGNMDGLDEFDYSFIYGLGINFELFKQKWFVDYRQTIGWNSLMMPTGEGGEPAPLRNQTYSFSLGIYF